jgi:hypothetical protein
MATEKKPWQTPELIVLVRSRPEESVLVNCKISGYGSGPEGTACLTGGVVCWGSTPS